MATGSATSRSTASCAPCAEHVRSDRAAGHRWRGRILRLAAGVLAGEVLLDEHRVLPRTLDHTQEVGDRRDLLGPTPSTSGARSAATCMPVRSRTSRRHHGRRRPDHAPGHGTSSTGRDPRDPHGQAPDRRLRHPVHGARPHPSRTTTRTGPPTPSPRPDPIAAPADAQSHPSQRRADRRRRAQRLLPSPRRRVSPCALPRLEPGLSAAPPTPAAPRPGSGRVRPRARDARLGRRASAPVGARSRLPTAVNRRARQGHGVGSLKS
jgi:hypothetical protein